MLSLESQIKTAADNAQNRFGKDIITDRYEFRGDITLTVAPAMAPETMVALVAQNTVSNIRKPSVGRPAAFV